MMTSSCGLGFAYDASRGDVGTQQVQSALRSQLATKSFSTVCSGYGQSSTHSRSVCDVPGIHKLWLETSIELWRLLTEFLLDFARCSSASRAFNSV